MSLVTYQILFGWANRKSELWRACGTYGEEDRRFGGETSEGKKPLGRPRGRWEDNITTDLQEVGCGGLGLDRVGSGKEQVSGTCECDNEPSGSIKCGESD